MTLPLLHEDESFIAVDKPGGLPVHGSGEAGEETVETVLRGQLGAKAVRSGFALAAVHRLDRDTSGVLLLARRKRACTRLMEQFGAGTVRKTYVALVLRGPLADAGTIDKPLPGIGKHEGKEQEARTDYRVLARSNDALLVECRPRTGRTHQIRRHLTEIGCPLACDIRYGSQRFNAHARMAWGLQRMFLHARELTFQHPDDGQEMTLRSPLPADLRAALEKAGLAFDAG